MSPRMPSPASRKQTELELRLSFKRIDAIVSVVKALLKYGATVACVYLAYLAVAALAGKGTFASLGLSILGNVTVKDSIYVVLTVGGIIYGLGQRQLRRHNIERLTKRPIELEKRFDPKRASSELTRRGTTRPEDR